WEQGTIVHLDSDCALYRNPAGCNDTMDSPAALDAAWHAGLEDFAGELRRRFDRVALSRPDRPPAILSNGSSDYFTWLNGTMHEHFPLARGAPDPGNAYNYAWMDQMFAQPGGYVAARFHSSPYALSIVNAGWSGTWAAPNRTADFERHKRFTLVSAMLG